jgi:hypothetical protein
MTKVDDCSEFWSDPWPLKYGILQFEDGWLVYNHIDRAVVLLETTEEIRNEVRRLMIGHGARIFSRADVGLWSLSEPLRRRPLRGQASARQSRRAANFVARDKLAEVQRARARLYEKREQILRLGTPALQLLTALLHRAPRRATSTSSVSTLFEEHG